MRVAADIVAECRAAVDASPRIPAGAPFGAETNAHRAIIRGVLISRGITAEPELSFDIENVREQLHEADPWPRERQEHSLFAMMLRASKGPRPPREALTIHEIDYLLDRLAGVNDPVGMRVRRGFARETRWIDTSRKMSIHIARTERGCDMTTTQIIRTAKKFGGWVDGDWLRFPTPHDKARFERAIAPPKVETITVNGKLATHVRKAR